MPRPEKTRAEKAEEALRRIEAEGPGDDIRPEPQTAAAVIHNPPAPTVPEGLMKPLDPKIVISSADMAVMQKGGRLRGVQKAAIINATPLVHVFIPLSEREQNAVQGKDLTKYPCVDILVDGHKWTIRKGVSAMVPQAIFDIMMERGVLAGKH